MDQKGSAGFALSDYGGFKNLLFGFVPRPGATDFANDAGTNAGIADAKIDVVNDLPGNLFDRQVVELRRVCHVDVVASAHDDV